MARCMDAIEEESGMLSESPDLASISAAVACSYADFRFRNEDWRTGHPRLASFFETFDQRRSMEMTRLFES